MRLRSVTMTRLVREISNDKNSLSEYERQSFTSILGTSKMRELEEMVDCLNGTERAKEQLGRQRCRYGTYCRNGDGKTCRFLHPERKSALRQVLIKELDRYAESKGYRRIARRGSGAEDGNNAGDRCEGAAVGGGGMTGARFSCRPKTRDDDVWRGRSMEKPPPKGDRSLERRGSRSPERRRADRNGDVGNRKTASFRSVVPIPRPRR